VAVSLAVVPIAAAASPRLDAGFAKGGIARVPFRHVIDIARTLQPMPQPDGKLVVAATIDGDHDFPQVALARFTRTGRPDPTFGRGGRVRIRSLGNFVPLRALAQPNGSILLVGTVGGYAYFYYAPQQLAIVRLSPDGSRDRSFGTNGLVAWNPPGHAGADAMDVFPGVVLPRPHGRLLVAANVDERTLWASPQASWHRVVLARFDPDGSVDESFGRLGTAELDWDGAYPYAWARLADGRIATALSRPAGFFDPPQWWLETFALDGTATGGLVSAGSVRLGAEVLDHRADLVPTRDGGVLMIGPDGGATAVRRILPNGQLDAGFGTACGRPRPPAFSWGGASVTSRGGLFLAATTFVVSGRQDSLFVSYDAHGCVTQRPLRLRAVSAGPPPLQPHRRVAVGASYAKGLALIGLRR